MSTLNEKLARGQRKLYYQIEDRFEAKGCLLTNTNMCYTAAGPDGLWLAEVMANNGMFVIGLLPWSNVKRMVVDTEHETVFVEPHRFEEAVANADTGFGMYKRSFTHRMSDTGELSLRIPSELFSSAVINYAADRVPVEIRTESFSDQEKRHDLWINLLYVALIALVVICFVSRFF